MRPHRRQPTRLPRPWDSPDENTGVGCHSLLQCMKVKSESEVTQSCSTQRPHGLRPTRLLRPWGFPGKSTGVGCHCLLWRKASEGQTALCFSVGLGSIPAWGLCKAHILKDSDSDLTRRLCPPGAVSVVVLMSRDPAGVWLRWSSRRHWVGWHLCSLLSPPHVATSTRRTWGQPRRMSAVSSWRCHHDNSGGAGSRLIVNSES